MYKRQAYISENRLDLAHKASYPLFTNRQHNRLTKEGVAYIINKYAVMAVSYTHLDVYKRQV